jgi:hypothetical protein
VTVQVFRRLALSLSPPHPASFALVRSMSWRSEKRRSRFATFSNVSVDSAPTGDSHAAAPGTTADADAQGSLLPPPVVACPASSKAARRARVEEKPRVRWAQFVRRIGAGSAPTESSVLNVSMLSTVLRALLIIAGEHVQ